MSSCGEARELLVPVFPHPHPCITSALRNNGAAPGLHSDTPEPRRCPAVAGNDDSWDFRLPTLGGGIHEKKNESEKIEPAEDQAWSP
jgi:hypothetical protein